MQELREVLLEGFLCLAAGYLGIRPETVWVVIERAAL